jgi:hypothetical protein
MTSFQECRARADLCRQFARLEPNSKSLWLAEAERWSRLTHGQMVRSNGHGEPAETWLESGKTGGSSDHRWLATPNQDQIHLR